MTQSTSHRAEINEPVGKMNGCVASAMAAWTGVGEALRLLKKG
jgi:hypothetical protein